MEEPKFVTRGNVHFDPFNLQATHVNDQHLQIILFELLKKSKVGSVMYSIERPDCELGAECGLCCKLVGWEPATYCVLHEAVVAWGSVMTSVSQRYYLMPSVLDVILAI